jgi:hypothetical protein
MAEGAIVVQSLERISATEHYQPNQVPGFIELSEHRSNTLTISVIMIRKHTR